MHSGEFLLAAALIAIAIICALELRDWWHPAPPPGTLQQRLQTAHHRPGLTVPQFPRWLQALLLGSAAAAGLFFLTFSATLSLIVAVLVGVGVPYMLPLWRQRQRREQARGELRLALDQLVVSLRSGHSLPTALGEWPDALARTLSSGRSVLLGEVQRVRDELSRGATPEEALGSLATRLQLEEAHMLARVVTLCRRRGGDLSQAVAQAAQMLSEKLDVAAQIRTLTAGKRAEAWVMTLSTPVLLTLIFLEDPQYLAPLVHTATGRVMLAASLVMQATAFLLGRWLLYAEV